MTSTEFTIGLGDGRSSSKVLKPPGGGCSDIFGTQGAQQNVSHKQVDTQNRLFGSAPEQTTPLKTDRMKSNIFGAEENAPKQSAKKYVQRNPITGEVTEIDLQTKNGDAKNENDDEKDINDESSEEKNDSEKTDEKNDSENTDEKNGDKTPEETEVKKHVPSVRVKQPPGGKSSGIF